MINSVVRKDYNSRFAPILGEDAFHLDLLKAHVVVAQSYAPGQGREREMRYSEVFLRFWPVFCRGLLTQYAKRVAFPPYLQRPNLARSLVLPNHKRE